MITKWKADPDSTDEEGNTPLHNAVLNNRLSLVEALLNAINPPVEQSNNNNNSNSSNNRSIAYRYLNRGDSKGRTAFYLAASWKHPDICQYLWDNYGKEKASTNKINSKTNELRLVEDRYEIEEAEMNQVKEFLRFKGFLPRSTTANLSNPPQ